MDAIAGALSHIQGEVLALQMQSDTSLPLGENELGLAVNLVKASN